jgi:6-phosphofructokinase 1
MEWIHTDSLGEATLPSPITSRDAFVPEGEGVRYAVTLRQGAPVRPEWVFEAAGPRQRLFFDPAQSRAAVVTCGGLAPGLNNVIRSIVMECRFHYGVPEVLGIQKGYAGLNPASGWPPVSLDPAALDDIHTEGGTILGSSRGRQDTGVMVDFLVAQGITQLFCIGGDGTLRGATAIADEVQRRGLAIAVIGIPKTIDNDVMFCDRTFGFGSAVDAARDMLEVAHVEAKAAERGIGLVKLMGRDAGFIACGATIASQKVNYTLIPEVPFALHDEGGLLHVLEERMERRDHALIAVAEGAGQELMADRDWGTDASGNRRYGDIGLFLREQISAYFAERRKPVEVKYINPSYLVRGIPANSEDSILCDRLARDAVHAAMAGRTACMVSLINNRMALVPLQRVTGQKRTVDLCGPLWQSVLAATGQPMTFGSGGVDRKATDV